MIYFFLLERMKTEKVEKLVAKFLGKEKYVKHKKFKTSIKRNITTEKRS